MAEKEVEIALIIEKAEDIPENLGDQIAVYAINCSKWKRPLILFWHLFNLKRNGYNKVFIRISWVAAVTAIITSWLTGQKSYFWISGQGNFEYYKKIKPGLQKIKVWIQTQFPLWFIKKHIDFFVTGPESMTEYYKKELKIDPSKIMVLYNDIDTTRFHKPETKEKKQLREKYNFPPHDTIILFVHRFSPVRKTTFYLPYILDVFFDSTQKDEILFVLVGGGPEKSKIVQDISRKHYADHVLFMGNIPNMEIDELYKTADIFIQPTYAEGFPRTLIEAMACGLPVVSTNAGGIKDILGEKQQKFMVDTSDRNGFAKNMINMFHNREVQEYCSIENLKRIGQYDTETVAEMYVDKIFGSK